MNQIPQDQQERKESVDQLIHDLKTGDFTTSELEELLSLVEKRLTYLDGRESNQDDTNEQHINDDGGNETGNQNGKSTTDANQYFAPGGSQLNRLANIVKHAAKEQRKCIKTQRRFAKEQRRLAKEQRKFAKETSKKIAKLNSIVIELSNIIKKDAVHVRLVV